MGFIMQLATSGHQFVDTMLDVYIYIYTRHIICAYIPILSYLFIMLILFYKDNALRFQFWPNPLCGLLLVKPVQ